MPDSLVPPSPASTPSDGVTMRPMAMLRQATARSQSLAHHAAVGKRTEVVGLADSAVRLLRGFKDAGADKDALHDMASSLHDQLSNIEARINRELDEQGLIECEAIDLGELDAFLRECA